MFKKKAKKLFNNPYGFFVDSKLIRSLNAKSSVIKTEKLSNQINIYDFNAVSCGELDRIRLVLSRNASLIFIKARPGEREVVATVSDKLEELTASFLSLDKQGFSVAYDHKGKLVKKIDAHSLLSFLKNNKIANFRFVSKETKVKFYFEIQIWTEDKEFYTAPKANMISRRLWKSTAKKYRLFEMGEVKFYNSIHGESSELLCHFDVDYVFTWVNSDDSEWKKIYNKYNPKKKTDANSISRFLSRDELMFSLRAIEKYAPWVRKIHIVSNCKPPVWLNQKNDRVNWVDHSEIFEAEFLPTFSSHAIEANIHKIKGLANYFIYSNDDFILSRPTEKNDFFETNGNCRIKFESWGNVNGDVVAGDPDYLNAARNCQVILEKDFGVRPAQLHCHAPQAMRVDIIEEMAVKYERSFRQTSQNKFRAISDIAVTGFLFHHYTYLTGRGVKDYTPTLLIQRNHDFKDSFEKILKQKDKNIFSNTGRYLSFCVNDGADSHLDKLWNECLNEFLDAYLPDKSTFEV